MQGGDLFGQLSCMRSGVWACSISGASCSEVYSLHAKAMRHLLETQPNLALDMNQFGERLTACTPLWVAGIPIIRNSCRDVLMRRCFGLVLNS